MIVEIKIPSPGESITEVEIANWFVTSGDIVEKDQEIAELESDKATLTLIAEDGGKINILVDAGETILVGAVACTIDNSFAGKEIAPAIKKKEEKKDIIEATKKEPVLTAKKVDSQTEHIKVTPVAKKLMEENNINVEDIIAGLKRLGKKEVLKVIESADTPQIELKNKPGSRDVERQKITTLRRKLSERLVKVKNETAMLTTFNEVDMLNAMLLRKKHQNKFVEKYGVKLGYMSLFTKAATIALKAFPAVNSMIDGDEVIKHEYADIAIAVQAPKGLMVPVIRNAETLSLAEIELRVKELAEKARNNKISIDEMTGGTFTITNGGTFGSLMSTPIINPPQSGILGMHNIVERPVAVNGQVVIRPMMYVALSYDHRIIDGVSSVGFLKLVKELVENPFKMLLEGNMEEMLLGI
ncbi:MAG: 2-oxoglutarate dehydrogenase complex dihydrolipoyllysine-residue succinyltransferase [Chlorobi bacterium]|nr:2-oxoglutarate dehydrogenase complex dihydrolipoyllysine-residue succinyltransferase [Chlorobiota bacterium]